jgi:GGDEF domain-containing protein
MTLAPEAALLAPPSAVDLPLPDRAAVVAHLAQRLRSSDRQPATLLIIGLLRRDEGVTVRPAALAAVTSFLAGSLRGEDFLGSTGPTEFPVVLSGREFAAENAAARLVGSVTALGMGLTAAAGIAAMSPELSSGEVLRRASLSLDTARRVGPGTVLRYSGPG